MNRLSAETSPYLLQHAENPVDWYPWGGEACPHALELLPVASGQRPPAAGRSVPGEVLGGEAAGEPGRAEQDEVVRSGVHRPSLRDC